MRSTKSPSQWNKVVTATNANATRELCDGIAALCAYIQPSNGSTQQETSGPFSKIVSGFKVLGTAGLESFKPQSDVETKFTAEILKNVKQIIGKGSSHAYGKGIGHHCTIESKQDPVTAESSLIEKALLQTILSRKIPAPTDYTYSLAPYQISFALENQGSPSGPTEG